MGLSLGDVRDLVPRVRLGVGDRAGQQREGPHREPLGGYEERDAHRRLDALDDVQPVPGRQHLDLFGLLRFGCVRGPAAQEVVATTCGRIEAGGSAADGLRIGEVIGQRGETGDDQHLLGAEVVAVVKGVAPEVERLSLVDDLHLSGHRVVEGQAALEDVVALVGVVEGLVHLGVGPPGSGGQREEGDDQLIAVAVVPVHHVAGLVVAPDVALHVGVAQQPGLVGVLVLFVRHPWNLCPAFSTPRSSNQDAPPPERSRRDQGHQLWFPGFSHPVCGGGVI